MASAPQANLPMFYNDLMPLNSRDHATWKAKNADAAPWLVGQHAIPLTAEEFPQAARHYPIIFASGENPVPLALMGLNEGVNVFVDEGGKVTQPIYIPAYVRRYPFLLAKLNPSSEELSLCFDPSSGLLGESDEGQALFTDGQPSDATKAALSFCEQFEQAGQRTQAFIDELKKHDLLMEGEVAIQQEGNEQPFIYRGFQMINQEKLREIRGDVLRGWAQSGLLPLLYAHLFSLELISQIFGAQVQLGKGPIPAITIPAA
ncbi:MAG: multidrug transporter [Novosphingobium sp. 28-62-57]|uniref:SapC family protein n=1 Tax=unclassified Novosphingobium TaxID=2644732 RepID=UPI000BCC7E1B|nr:MULTISPECIES: SapC family protein [unclassified Novosphingobium]OYW49336.1 MAG: multidrug transporter [Novosphingobium sp. 12-62-10]OYZ09092.1 MAG: multidrug transporter [Novosphingobium sp. 28-62-57]